MGHTQLLQVIQAGGMALIAGTLLGHTQILATPLLLDTGGAVDGVFPDVHLIDDGIGVAHALIGADIAVPAGGVGGGHVQHHAAIAVNAGGLGIGVHRFVGFVGEGDLVVVVASVQITGNGDGPHTLVAPHHVDLLDPGPVIALSVKIAVAGRVADQLHIPCGGRPGLEGGAVFGPGGAQIVTGVGVIPMEAVGVEDIAVRLDHVFGGIDPDSQTGQLLQHHKAAQIQRAGGVYLAVAEAGDAHIRCAAVRAHQEHFACIHRRSDLEPQQVGLVIHLCAVGGDNEVAVFVRTHDIGVGGVGDPVAVYHEFVFVSTCIQAQGVGEVVADIVHGNTGPIVHGAGYQYGRGFAPIGKGDGVAHDQRTAGSGREALGTLHGVGETGGELFGGQTQI